MKFALRSRSARSMVAGLLPAALIAMLALHVVTPAGGSRDIGHTAAQPGGTASAGGAAATSDVVLRFGNGVATATLGNTRAAGQFSRMLPARLTLHDPMGQAKSGRLPERIDLRNAETVTDLQAGSIYYWPPSGDLAIVYDDLTASVPPPGAVLLGTVDSGLEAIAAAGNGFEVSIDLG